MIVYAIIDVRSSPYPPLGDAIETFMRREDAKLPIFIPNPIDNVAIFANVAALQGLLP